MIAAGNNECIQRAEALHNLTINNTGGVDLETSTTQSVEKKEEVFSRRVRAGKRTYFFDVKATKSEKDFYITITESKKIAEDEFKKHKIFLYKEDFEKFADALAEAVDFVHDELGKQGIPLTTPSEEAPVSEPALEQA
jgi:hypothetical protein